MVPKQRIPLEKRGMIIALHQEGLNQRDISQRVRCSQTSDHYIKKERECGSVRDKNIPGRKRKTTSREDRALVRSSLSNRRNTAPALKEHHFTQVLASICPLQQ